MDDTRLDSLADDWKIVLGHHLHANFEFPDFATALAFVNQIGELAEAQNHHPNINFTWGRVTVEIWTHDADGLTDADFALAKQIDAL